MRGRSGAEGETVAESVPAVAGGEVGGAAEVTMVYLVCLWLARGDERGAGDSRGVCEFRTGSGGQRLFSHTSSSLGTCIRAGKPSVL